MLKNDAAAELATTVTSAKANNKIQSPAIATEPTDIMIQPLMAVVDAATSNSHNKKRTIAGPTETVAEVATITITSASTKESKKNQLHLLQPKQGLK